MSVLNRNKTRLEPRKEKMKPKTKKKTKWRPVFESYLTCHSLEGFCSRTSNPLDIRIERRKGFPVRRLFKRDDVMWCASSLDHYWLAISTGWLFSANSWQISGGEQASERPKLGKAKRSRPVSAVFVATLASRYLVSFASSSSALRNQNKPQWRSCWVREAEIMTEQ